MAMMWRPTTLGYTGSADSFVVGHGCVVVFENGVILFPIIKNSTTLEAHYGFDIYKNGTATSALLDMATVYPTLRVPSMYKPFYGLVSAATWNVKTLILSTDEKGAPMPTRVSLPLSYKFEGTIYNGLTYGNHFTEYGRTTHEFGTYFIFDDKRGFYDELQQAVSGRGGTARDYEPVLPTVFGANSTGDGVFREIAVQDTSTENVKEITNIVYVIKEGTPTTFPMRAMSGRYRGGIDYTILSDDCNISNIFPDNLSIKIFNANSGLAGPCAVYVNELPNKDEFKFYRTSVQLFDKSTDPMKFTDLGGTYCLGIFNQNATNDKKGSMTPVTVEDNKYCYAITNDDGQKVNRKKSSESDIEDEGISLVHKYTLNSVYKENVSRIADVVDNSADGTDIMTDYDPGNQTTVFTGSNVETFIAVYTKKTEGSKNEMVIFKLYPLGSLDVIYPANSDGVEAYITVETSIDATSDSQTITIPASSNVKFKVTTNTQWISISSGENYPAGSSNIRITLQENTGASSRSGTIVLESTEEGTSESVTVTITQAGAQSQGD